MKSNSVKDAAANWLARLATLPAEQRDRATATLLALMRARAAAERVLDSSTRFSRKKQVTGGVSDSDTPFSRQNSVSKFDIEPD